MSKENSYNRINYYLRPNKQVERKIMIEIIQNLQREISISEYCYIGMGSIYYYDFILMHKILGLKHLISIDNKTTPKRFEFNKPYEFINFENTTTSDFLLGFQWNKHKNLIWLDYDEKFINNDFLDTDLSIISKNSNHLDIVFITLNSTGPKYSNRLSFLNDNKRYITPSYFNLKYTDSKEFHLLIQNILLNKIKEYNLHNDNKFLKICSFVYQDGAPMYTLGGIFTHNQDLKQKIEKYHHLLSTENDMVSHIKIPNITYKEKFYLDSKIDSLKEWINQYRIIVNNLDLKTEQEKEEKLSELLNSKMDIELSPFEIENYINNYIYFPQYYEGLI
jgi:hypothetical protein